MCHGRVVDAAGHLADGVGRGGSDEQQVRLAANAAKLHMLHLAGNLRDHRMGCGVFQGVRVQDLLLGSAGYSVHLCAAPDQIANKVHDPHSGDAACNSYYDRLSTKRFAY
jgi:hypothetical protein